MKNLTRAMIAATLAAGAFAAAPAHAQEVFEFRVERASLNSDADVRRAYQRLEAEATRYCRSLDLRDRNQTARCRIDVVSHVVEATGHDALDSLHRERTQERMIAGAGGR